MVSFGSMTMASLSLTLYITPSIITKEFSGLSTMWGSSRGARTLAGPVSSNLGSSSGSTSTNITRLQVRFSHIGSAALYVPPSTKLTTLPFAPVANPSRRQPDSLQNVKSIQVEGPLGMVLVPLADFVQLQWEESSSQASTSSTSNDPKKLMLTVEDAKEKKQRSVWGLTRALLSNAIEGVEDGHVTLVRLVGVGYRAVVETDPFPRPDKFEVALSTTPANFKTPDQHNFYAKWTAEQAQKAGPERKRLALRLGYSHPIFLPIPRGINCTTPAPTRIIIKGSDKEQVGLFASQIRHWRKPEPYKGKGVFVGDETIRLKAARKK